MQKIFLKFLNVIAFISYPKIPRKYRYYVRDNYFSRIFQSKYWIIDYFSKRKYKVIEYHGEFQQELTFVLPFAYWHFLNGTLKKTISCDDTKELYFFSDHHEELHKKRDWVNNAKNFEIPNMTHSPGFSYKKWAAVPLKQHYKNELLKFEKPILIIANKYNIEWENDPINFFSIPVLKRVISLYSHKYQIIYNRPSATQIVSDGSDILDLHEYEWLRKDCPDVLLMSDLYQKHRSSVNNFNHFQLKLYANCERFLSVHGGTAALASYFGGVNIIFSRSGLEHLFNEFATIFPSLSGARVLHAKNEDEIFTYVAKYF